MTARTLIVLAAGALALAGAASAGTGYRVGLGAPARVQPGAALEVTVRGAAQRRSVLNVFLDHRPCAKDARRESNRFDTGAGPPAGDSYFISAEGARVVFYSVPVRGSFVRLATAHAGTKPETENLCAYLDVLDAQPPSQGSAATAHRSFTVT